MTFVRLIMQFIGIGCILYGGIAMFRDLVLAIRDIPVVGTADYGPIAGLMWFGIMLILAANNV